MFSNKPNYLKLRTNLRLCINRLKLLEKKKTELALKARREIADYIAAGKEDRARIRVEHIIREDYLVEAMEIIEMLCDLLLARFGLIEKMTEIDPGLEEAISTIIWVTPRMVSDVQELKEVSLQLTIKYGKEYAEMCRRNGFENVNEKVLHKMTLSAPPKILVENYMLEIARTYKVPFEPDPVIMMGQPPDTNDLIELGLDSLQANTSGMPLGGSVEGSPAEKINRSNAMLTPSSTAFSPSGAEGFGGHNNNFNSNGQWNGGAPAAFSPSGAAGFGGHSNNFNSNGQWNGGVPAPPPAEDAYYESLRYDDRAAGGKAGQFKPNTGGSSEESVRSGCDPSLNGLRNNNPNENAYEVLDYSSGQDGPPSWKVADAGDATGQFARTAGIGLGVNSSSAHLGPGFDVGENGGAYRNTVPMTRSPNDVGNFGGFGVPTYRNPVAGGVPVLPMDSSKTLPYAVRPNAYDTNVYANEVSPPPQNPSPGGTLRCPPPPPGRPPNSGNLSANVSPNRDAMPSLPPYEEFMKATNKYPVPTPRAYSNDTAPGLPDIPNLPDIPGLPSVPTNSVGGASVGGDDVDFDDLTRRFEQLKKRK